MTATNDGTPNKSAKETSVHSKSPVNPEPVCARNKTPDQLQSTADPASSVAKAAKITEPVPAVNGRESPATGVTTLSDSPNAKKPPVEAPKPRPGHNSKNKDANKTSNANADTATVSAVRLENVLSGKLFISEKSLFGYKPVARFYRLRSDGLLLLFNDKKFSQEKLVSHALCGKEYSMPCFRMELSGRGLSFI